VVVVVGGACHIYMLDVCVCVCVMVGVCVCVIYA